MYLFLLADRLSRGLRELQPARISRHRRFLLSQQTDSGGFRGREGDGDLYYTGFAVRGLAVTGGLDDGCRDSLQMFLRRFDVLSLGLIDQLSWLYSALVVQAAGGADLLEDFPVDLRDRICKSVESLRTRDGGFAKAAGGAMGSTYQSFLALLLLELLGAIPLRRNALVQFLYDRQRDDGGFVEITPMKRSGTNPTAAAVALLRQLHAMEQDITDDVCGFLTDVISTEGGFQANTRIPFADGLSTFTGLLTAQDLGHPGLIPPVQIEHWVSNCLELPEGGFRGASWDQQADVEYTFYGLGILGLLLSETKTTEEPIGGSQQEAPSGERREDP
jgi:geranylgeranyl transferase type-2 subunit beta